MAKLSFPSFFVVSQEEGAKKRIRPLYLAGILLLSAALIVGGIFLVRWATDPYDNRIVSGVTIGGLDVGGMTKKEARNTLEEALNDTLLSRELEIRLPQQTLYLNANETQLKADIRSAVQTAFAYGRTGTEEEQQSAANTPCEIGLLPYLEYNEEAIRSELDAYAAQYDTTVSESSYRMDGDMPSLSTENHSDDTPCQTLVLTKGQATVKLDVDAVYDQILAVYDNAVSAGRSGQYRVEILEIAPDAVPQELDLEAICEEFTIAPVDDSLDMEAYAFVPGSYGYTFSADTAAELFAQVPYGESVSISMEYVEPELLGEEVYFRDVLGTCETKHNTNENRNTNLRLICDILNGYVLQPGEEFSFNGVVGERTAERGFKPAPAYSGNRLTNAVGGGACQTSTTLYNCVLLADLEVVTRFCHGAMVTYVPLGLDAAVNWGTTDFAFRNNFHFPIKIEAEVSDGYVKMKILGTDEKDYYIVMTSGYDDSGETCIYAVSNKNKYDKETGELISKDREAFSTYYKNIG